MQPGPLRRLERWAAARGVALERVRYARPEARGEAAALRLAPAAGARARVVAAHGAGDDALYPLVGVFQALVEDGVEVFTFDVDGNGSTSTTLFAPETVTGAVPAAVAEATRRGPDLPLHLFGHSFGGALALHALASGAVPRARSAVAVSAPLGVEPTWRIVLWEALGIVRPATLGQLRSYGWWGIVPAAGPVKRRAFPFRTRAPGPTGYVGEVRRALGTMDLERAAARISRPVLLVHGAADRLVPPDNAGRLARAIPCAELVVLPRLTHFGTVIARETAERVRRWVGGEWALTAPE